MRKNYETMLKTMPAPSTQASDGQNIKRTINRIATNRRSQSMSPSKGRPGSPSAQRHAGDRRCQSLSPTLSALDPEKESMFSTSNPHVVSSSAPESIHQTKPENIQKTEKDTVLPQYLVQKTLRILSTKKREFMKMHKNFIAQQKNLLSAYAILRELEVRAGVAIENSLGEVRMLSVTGWPAHDLLLLLRDDLNAPMNSRNISGLFGPQILQQIHSQLNPIPEDVLGMGAELMARRIDLLNTLRGKNRISSTSASNLEWKTKNTEFDNETERLHRMVAGTVENLKAKVNYCMKLIEIPWLDREALIKKMERQQKDLMVLQSRLDEVLKKEDNSKEGKPKDRVESQPSNINDNYQAVCEELAKEKSAREALKEVVASAESMLRVARGRISTLERQLKDVKNELEMAKKKHKDFEQLFRQRESSYDARSKKLLEVSKTGELTIGALSRQRDALELRVKELREQIQTWEKNIESREEEEKHRVETLQAKVAEQVPRCYLKYFNLISLIYKKPSRRSRNFFSALGLVTNLHEKK